MTENASQNVPNIQINAQYIKDLSFEAPLLPQILTEITNPMRSLTTSVRPWNPYLYRLFIK